MKVTEFVLRLIFVPKCPFCGAVLHDSEGDGPCEACKKTLPLLHGKQAVTACRFTEKCVSPLKYRDGVRRAICRYKFISFSGTGIYCRCFAKMMAPTVKEHYEKFHIQCIAWVPVSAKRKRKRGYDQAELIARELGKRLDLPVVSALTKIKDNQANSGISQPERRRANVEGVYKVSEPGIIEDKMILLVDDVITTGSTMSECAKALLLGGAAGVLGVTVAKAKG